MAFEGLDVDGAQTVVSALNNAPSDLQGILNNLTNQIQGIQWQGSDQQQFLSTWQEASNQLMNRIHQVLQDTATHLTQEINQQTQASAS